MLERFAKELQLLVTLAEVFMFHVTKTMFNSVISGPSGGNVSSDILKNISASLGGLSTPHHNKETCQDLL